MKQLVTTGIILNRTNFGEADRILTVLTTDQGKLRLIAKGARRVKSKLAGGIEVFSVSDLTFIPGRSGIGTLVSSRLKRHYPSIVQDINCTMLAYELLRRINRATEDGAEGEYFTVLQAALAALGEGLSSDLVELWFDAQIIKLSGHRPNLTTDNSGAALSPAQSYSFNFQNMAFAPTGHQGPYGSAHIKLLRLVFNLSEPLQLKQLKNTQPTLGEVLHLQRMVQQSL